MSEVRRTKYDYKLQIYFYRYVINIFKIKTDKNTIKDK